ncbi:formate dehydrogenase accessory sulfurtransferase FdhD [Janthinobacterium fluminis]|uniref:Sulfur carrier protein FdhD n=1 Tax=Janthinobacterium fluminis TaxID=2987524 RepID=A0ABT5K065_9BURK|nr:formate dehydrogenase accessory sulfurtransferase FdhD [Janthinobacterium fluminis]MDC8758358.1 formate dehydrogenase accessory sulfurtransferase FdhD [Janthinobacterium fluminis]
MSVSEPNLAAWSNLPVTRHAPGGAGLPTSDAVAEETPVALVYNGVAHAVMMATPLDLDDFGVGFSLSERIVDSAADIYDIDCVQTPGTVGIELRMTISGACFMRLKEKRRSLAGNTGCGLCGLESLGALDTQLPPVTARAPVGKAALMAAFGALAPLQALNALTGAVHAAAWAGPDGAIALVREDVGRHNALDKLIGALARGGARRPGFAIMSSRASYELVQKAARADIGLLATISAPTALAVDMAERAGICLVGFARQHGCVVYAHADRLLAA